MLSILRIIISLSINYLHDGFINLAGDTLIIECSMFEEKF